MVYGTYGSEEGRLLIASTVADISYGKLRLDVCRQDPLILTCQSVSPTFQNSDNYAVRVESCYNRFLGEGLLQGAQWFGQPEDPNLIHVVIQHTVTFPAHPV